MKISVKCFMKPALFVMVTMFLFSCNNNKQVNAITQSVESKQEEVKKDMFEEVRGVTIPDFSVSINDEIITNMDLADYPMYKAEVTSINSSGTETTTNYIGFKFVDALDFLNIKYAPKYIEVVADDGYSIDYDGLNYKNMMIAVSKNGSQFKRNPWFCPCDSKTTGDYLQSLIQIYINDKNEKPNVETTNNKGNDKEEKNLEISEPVKEDKSDKVVFNSFSFIIDGKEVTNEMLDGLKIFKIKAFAENNSGDVVENTYTGFVLKDVLDKLNINDFNDISIKAIDGYNTNMPKDDAISEFTLIAIEKDKETGENNTVWVAPCKATSTKKYISKVNEIVINK